MNIENAKQFSLTYPNGDRVTFEAVIENEEAMLKCYANNILFTTIPVGNLPLVANTLNNMYFSIVNQNNENKQVIN